MYYGQHLQRQSLMLLMIICEIFSVYQDVPDFIFIELEQEQFSLFHEHHYLFNKNLSAGGSPFSEFNCFFFTCKVPP